MPMPTEKKNKREYKCRDDQGTKKEGDKEVLNAAMAHNAARVQPYIFRFGAMQHCCKMKGDVGMPHH